MGNCCSPGCRLWCLFVLSFFPRDVLGGILNLIESVSEGFPTYSLYCKREAHPKLLISKSKFSGTRKFTL